MLVPLSGYKYLFLTAKLTDAILFRLKSPKIILILNLNPKPKVKNYKNNMSVWWLETSIYPSLRVPIDFKIVLSIRCEIINWFSSSKFGIFRLELVCSRNSPQFLRGLGIAPRPCAQARRQRNKESWKDL